MRGIDLNFFDNDSEANESEFNLNPLPEDIVGPSMDNPKGTIEFLISQLEESLAKINDRIDILAKEAVRANKAIMKYYEALEAINPPLNQVNKNNKKCLQLPNTKVPLNNFTNKDVL